MRPFSPRLCSCCVALVAVDCGCRGRCRRPHAEPAAAPSRRRSRLLLPARPGTSRATGKVDEAIAAHKRRIELEPKSAELRAELAGVYARQDRAPRRSSSAEAALEPTPRTTKPTGSSASIYAALRRAEAAAPARRRSVDVSGARDRRAREGARRRIRPRPRTSRSARLYLRTGRVRQGVPLLRRVVDSSPGIVDAAVLLSTAQESAGHARRGDRNARSAARSTTRASIAGRFASRRSTSSSERWSAAADAYAQAQTLNPRAPLSTRRAVALLSTRPRRRGARRRPEGDGAGGPESTDPVLLYLLAESAAAVLKDLDAAHATAQKLLATNPDDVRALHVMSLILQDKGDVKGAERSLRDLIARDPLDANALNSLGYMFAERGERLDEAVELLQRALKVEPGNPSFLDSLGWAYFQQGRLDLADPALSEAAAKLRGNSVVQDHLGDLRFKQQRFADAVGGVGTRARRRRPVDRSGRDREEAPRRQGRRSEVGHDRLLVLAACAAPACAPKLATLPTGPGSPFPEFHRVSQATERCRGVRTLARCWPVGARRRVDAARPDHAGFDGARQSAARAAGTAAGRSSRSRPRWNGDAGAGARRPCAAQRAAGGRSSRPWPGSRLGPAELRAVVAGCGFGAIEPARGRVVRRRRAAVEADQAGGNATVYLRTDGERMATRGR